MRRRRTRQVIGGAVAGFAAVVALVAFVAGSRQVRDYEGRPCGTARAVLFDEADSIPDSPYTDGADETATGCFEHALLAGVAVVFVVGLAAAVALCVVIVFVATRRE